MKHQLSPPVEKLPSEKDGKLDWFATSRPKQPNTDLAQTLNITGIKHLRSSPSYRLIRKTGIN
jgi:hypothetical protein